MSENRKSKGGRPPKTAAAKYSETVRFRVTAAQMQTLRQSAAKSRLTLSEYARQMVLTGKVITPASPEELRLIAELTREKNNLNQLAKAQNAAGEFPFRRRRIRPAAQPRSDRGAEIRPARR